MRIGPVLPGVLLHPGVLCQCPQADPRLSAAQKETLVEFHRYSIVGYHTYNYYVIVIIFFQITSLSRSYSLSSFSILTLFTNNRIVYLYQLRYLFFSWGGRGILIAKINLDADAFRFLLQPRIHNRCSCNIIGTFYPFST